MTSEGASVRSISRSTVVAIPTLSVKLDPLRASSRSTSPSSICKEISPRPSHLWVRGGCPRKWRGEMDRLEQQRLDRERLEGRLVLIVDLEDEPLFTQSLRTALEDAGAASWVASSERDALVEANKERPDLVIIDLEFPHSRVVTVGNAIKSTSPESVIVSLGSFYDSRFALEVLRSGFRGYL